MAKSWKTATTEWELGLPAMVKILNHMKLHKPTLVLDFKAFEANLSAQLKDVSIWSYTLTDKRIIQSMKPKDRANAWNVSLTEWLRVFHSFTRGGVAKPPKLRFPMRERAAVTITVTSLIQHAELCLEWLSIHHRDLIDASKINNSIIQNRGTRCWEKGICKFDRTWTDRPQSNQLDGYPHSSLKQAILTFTAEADGWRWRPERNRPHSLLAETKMEKTKERIDSFSGLGATIELRPKSHERPTSSQVCSYRKKKKREKENSRVNLWLWANALELGSHLSPHGHWNQCIDSAISTRSSSLPAPLPEPGESTSCSLNLHPEFMWILCECTHKNE